MATSSSCRVRTPSEYWTNHPLDKPAPDWIFALATDNNRRQYGKTYTADGFCSLDDQLSHCWTQQLCLFRKTDLVCVVRFQFYWRLQETRRCSSSAMLTYRLLEKIHNISFNNQVQSHSCLRGHLWQFSRSSVSKNGNYFKVDVQQGPQLMRRRSLKSWAK